MQRSTSKQKSATDTGKIKQQLPSLWLEIFYMLSLVQDQVLPLFPSKTRMICSNQFVGSNAHVKCIRFRPTHPFQSSLFLSSIISQDLEIELVSKELNHLAAILHVYARGLNFFLFCYYFSKRKWKYFYTFNHFFT